MKEAKKKKVEIPEEFIGLSTPNMLNSKRYKEAEGLVTNATDKPHLYTTAGFHLKLNNAITLSFYAL